jgi:hypothetical protein
VIASIKGRPAHETLESLRLTLLKIEQSVEPDHDAVALADLKRILLQRIAELEAIEIIESVSTANAQIPDPAVLVPPGSMTVEDSKDISTDFDPATPPAKPD